MARLLICSSCVTSDAGQFADELASALDAADLSTTIEIGTVECMGACASPIAIALQGTGLASYVFASLRGVSDIADVIATCRIYLASPQGLIVDARPCGRLRHLLRVRLPPLT